MLVHVKVQFTEPILGTAPSNPDIYSDFVATKKFKQAKSVAKTDEEKAAITEQEEALIKEELAMLPEDNGKALTVFRRDPGGLIIPDHMVRGFLKEAASAIGINGKTWGLASKIDKHIFVVNAQGSPTRTLPLTRDGIQLFTPDGIYERPLRAMTQMGPRITLAASEIVNPPAELSFSLYVLPLGERGNTKGEGAITLDVLRSWLDYGQYCGIGQFRTGSYGRFNYTEVVL